MRGQIAKRRMVLFCVSDLHVSGPGQRSAGPNNGNSRKSSLHDNVNDSSESDSSQQKQSGASSCGLRDHAWCIPRWDGVYSRGSRPVRRIFRHVLLRDPTRMELPAAMALIDEPSTANLRLLSHSLLAGNEYLFVD